MINPFTVQAKISRIQEDVLKPLYTTYQGQSTDHAWLLVETGRAVSYHQSFIEEVCGSRLVATIFKIIKLLGGAEQLTAQDFERFTSYVNDGGIKAMITMLLAADKERTFVDELGKLPADVRKNAADMLEKSKHLHRDFIHGYFVKMYGSIEATPPLLQQNLAKSETFIAGLSQLARANQ